MPVVATAGHVDHGKSSLVRALTGTDPDRWEEEKARGLTIDLGFAALELPSGRPLSFIDVPGHIRFIRNMLAGVGAVDGCVFVVSATEGWKPQSEEHLRILDMLGIERGVVALTKVDLVDDDLRELAELEIEDHVAGTFLEGAPVIGVSAVNRVGLASLIDALDRLVDETPAPPAGSRLRVWVDRSFAPPGAGTVITGTTTGAGLSVGDDVDLVPGAHRARIREMQSHHEKRPAIGPGERAAINLVGVGHRDIGRGHAVVRADEWHHTDRIDAELRVLDALGHKVSRRGAYAVYLGSAEANVRLRVLGPNALAPGETGLVRLHLDRQLPLVPGDRFVLREQGRDETVGGGLVLDVEPQLPASRARPDRSVDRLVAERGWVEADHLSRIAGTEVTPTVGRWVVDPTILTSEVDTLRAELEAAGAEGLDVAGLGDRRRALLERIDEAAIRGTRVVLGEPADPFADLPWLAELAASPFRPPAPDDVDRQAVRELVRQGRVIDADGVFFAPSAVALAAAAVQELLAGQPEGVTMAEIRDRLDTTRKWALPIIGILDRNGATRRREDLRIAGPRLAALAAGEAPR